MTTPPVQPKAPEDAGAFALQCVAAWSDIDAALAPVIGRRGVAALYKRSLHLTTPAYPWLAPVVQGAQEPGDFSALLQALGRQKEADAIAAHEAVLHKFHEMLTNLIGESLTGRLMQPLRGPVTGPEDAQDKP